jgi:maltose/maltodextrin transport system substrate-binding protein
MKSLHSVLFILLTVFYTSSTYAVEDGKLLVWINGDKPYKALEKIGAKFEQDTGISVKVEHPVDLTTKFAQAAQAGRGPDIVIWAHDRLGDWVNSGLLRPLNFTQEYKDKFLSKSWEGFQINGQDWGYPIHLEAITLIYNKKLISEGELPKKLSDIRKLNDKYKADGAYSLIWAYDTPFFTWPFLAGAGGYVFGQNAEGQYDINDVGVNTSGAVDALSEIGNLIDDNIIPKGASYDVMSAKMNDGKLAMMITGPWAWGDLENAGIDFGISIIPGLNKPAKPFVGVVGAMVDAKTPNWDLVELFMTEYVLTDKGLLDMADDVFCGVPAMNSAYDLLKEDPRVVICMDNVLLGDLMPNVPQMGTFWSAVEVAMKSVTTGGSKAKPALDNAKKIMLEANK